MPRVNVIELRRLFEAGQVDVRQKRARLNPFYAEFPTWLAKGQIKAEDVSMGHVFEEFVPNGRELRRSYDTRNINTQDQLLLEANGSVDTSAFSNVYGQVVYSKIMERWKNPDLIWNQLVDNTPTNLNGERIGGVGGVGDVFQTVGEGQDYPRAGFSEEWVDTPQTTKRGAMLTITKEAVFHDNGIGVLNNAARFTDGFAINKEKRVLDTVLGITTSYRYKSAAAQASYVDSPYDNLCATNALVDYTSIDAARRLFQAMVDPTTGEPIGVLPNTIIIPLGLDSVMDRIQNSTQIVQGQISASVPRTYSPMPQSTGKYRVVTCQYVASRTGNNTTWFIGDPKRAFTYMMNWDITPTPMPANSYEEWNRDIIAGWKVSEKGVPAVIEPRYMVKNTA